MVVWMGWLAPRDVIAREPHAGTSHRVESMNHFQQTVGWSASPWVRQASLNLVAEKTVKRRCGDDLRPEKPSLKPSLKPGLTYRQRVELHTMPLPPSRPMGMVESRSPERARALRVFIARIVTGALLCISCNGCFNADQEPKDDDKAFNQLEKPKPDFEKIETYSLPGDGRTAIIRAKPGHWTETTHTCLANKYNFIGELAVEPLDETSQVILLEKSLFAAQSTRPAILPQGQRRRLETIHFVPRQSGDSLHPVIKHSQLRTDLRHRSSRRPVLPSAVSICAHLPASVYHLVVLAENPDDYGYLNKLHSISMPRTIWGDRLFDYSVVVPDVQQKIPLPTGLSTWTSTAYVIWDGVVPDALSTKQQTAMVDWLHWGGQLIIVGRNSLDLLRGSFLDPFLPARYVAAKSMDPAALDRFNAQWSRVFADKGEDQSRRQLGGPTGSSIEFVEVERLEQAEYLQGTEKLIVERRAGRGRVCYVALSLTDPRIVNWSGFDSFFNAAVLRRPARRFEELNEEIRVAWRGMPGFGRDARINCDLRLFSRDYSAARGRQDQVVDSDEVPSETTLNAGDRVVIESRANDGDTNNGDTNNGDTGLGDTGERNVDAGDMAGSRTMRPGEQEAWPGEQEAKSTIWQQPYLSLAAFMNDRHSGVGGWNDFSDVSTAARRALTDGAGVKIPKRRFVVQVLAAYLLCLVPVNWLLFRFVNRLEYAWVAAPLIAVVATGAVIKLAQLDVGFVRSRTEISIFETQSGYDRALVTRYCGLYTSLATTYRLDYADPATVALPFSTDPSHDQLRHQRRHTVGIRKSSDNQLRQLPVISNATGMVHSDEMVTMRGRIRFDLDPNNHSYRVQNLTGFDWRNGLLLGRNNGTVVAAWLGSMPEGSVHLVEPCEPAQDVFPERNLQLDSGDEGDNPINIFPLWKIAASTQSLGEGDWRLIATRHGEIEGVEIRPASSQQTAVTLLVAHLRYGAVAAPQADANGLPKELFDLYDEELSVKESPYDDTDVMLDEE